MPSKKGKKFTIENIGNDKYYQRFLKKYPNLKETTKTLYNWNMRTYCNFIGLSPTELIKEARDDQETVPYVSDRRIDEYFVNFYEYLKSDKKSFNTIDRHFTLVKTFYKEFEITLPNLKITNKNNEMAHVRKKIPDKGDIKIALNKASLKYRAMILLMSSSGMGAGEIRSLTYENFIESIEEYYKPTKYELFDINTIKQRLGEVKEPLILEWKIMRIKTERPYVAFSSPEATETLLQYLENRELNNKPLESLNDYLFIGYNGQMHERTITSAFERINDACGFGKVGKYAFFRSHNMRHFFKTSLTNAGVEDLRSKSLMGQKGLDLGSIYDDPAWHDLKRDYMKGLEHLSIMPLKARIIADEESERLYSELKTLKSDIESKDEENKLLKEQLDEMRNDVASLKELKDLINIPKIKTILEQQIGK
ncbi:hypothetical protein [Methanobacterium sp.]|uniref:hypothetical protein n=1 Tax=Methanobacterium sp. TaxID=2164 RepID=UPI003C7869C3